MEHAKHFQWVCTVLAEKWETIKIIFPKNIFITNVNWDKEILLILSTL